MLAGNIAGRTRTLPLAIYSDVASGNMSGALNYVLIICILSFAVVVALNYFTLKGARAHEFAGGCKEKAGEFSPWRSPSKQKEDGTEYWVHRAVGRA